MTELINFIAGIFVLIIMVVGILILVGIAYLFVYKEVVPIFTGHFPYGARIGTWQERRQRRALEINRREWEAIGEYVRKVREAEEDRAE